VKFDTNKIKDKIRSKKKPAPDLHSRGLSTGLTLLNLACSGKPDAGILPGTYNLLVGDSRAGKSFLALTCLAEASINPKYANYRLIFDNAEGGALMDMVKFFGRDMAGRIESPGKNGKHSNTVEEFYYHLDDAAKEKIPFIYVLDSMDALSSNEEREKFQEQKAAARKGKETTGSYGTDKAKKNSTMLREARNLLEATGSILIMISQSRTNIGFGSQFNPKTRSGGLALRFFATNEIWFSIKGQIKKKVNGKDRKIGDILQIQVKKNRQTGREPIIEVPFYPGSENGFDDLGSCVNYLVEEGHWKSDGSDNEEGKKKKSAVHAEEFGFSGSPEQIVRMVIDKNLEADLREIVTEVWGEIEAQCRVERKRRYE